MIYVKTTINEKQWRLLIYPLVEMFGFCGGYFRTHLPGRLDSGTLGSHQVFCCLFIGFSAARKSLTLCFCVLGAFETMVLFATFSALSALLDTRLLLFNVILPSLDSRLASRFAFCFCLFFLLGFFLAWLHSIFAISGEESFSSSYKVTRTSFCFYLVEIR